MAIKGKRRTKNRPVTRAPRRAPVAVKPHLFGRRWFQLAAVFVAGILTPELLARYRRYSILGIAIFAAVITPSSDPYTMLAMMIPMYLFYEASIIIGRFLKRGSRTV